jgi:hypothetical protein
VKVVWPWPMPPWIDETCSGFAAPLPWCRPLELQAEAVMPVRRLGSTRVANRSRDGAKLKETTKLSTSKFSGSF